MIINEKALATAMKDSYKGTGYEVVGYTLGEELFLMLHGIGWLAEMPLANAPRKILGLIAEHLGVIPGRDEAYRVSKKGGQQTEIPALGNAVVPQQFYPIFKAIAQIEKTFV